MAKYGISGVVGPVDKIMVQSNGVDTTSCAFVPSQAAVTEGSATVNTDNTDLAVKSGFSTPSPQPQIITAQLSKDVYDPRVWQVSMRVAHRHSTPRTKLWQL